MSETLPCPKKVLYLHHMAQLAGAEHSLQLLLTHVNRELVEPMFGGPPTGPFPECLARAGIPVFPLSFGPLRNLPSVLHTAWQTRGLIRQHRVDLLHSNGPQTNLCAGLAGRLTGIPVIWHARNLLHGRMRDIDRTMASLATRIICNSAAIRERFRGSRAWEKTVTIYNAVDPREFFPSDSQKPLAGELGLPEHELSVGIVGRIGLGKGHEDFVDAATALIRKGVKAQFLIVGDTLFPGDAWRVQALQRRIKDAGVDHRIRLTGFRRDIPRVLQSLDILVLASEAEPCGRVLFEGMASGVPIVATNSGGTPEIVRHGHEGLLIPPHDPNSLAQSISDLLNHHERRSSLGRAGALRARQEFSIERHVSRTLEVYAAARAN